MYDELVKRLREAEQYVPCIISREDAGQAADAIEELSAKYKKALQDLVKQAEPPKEETIS